LRKGRVDAQSIDQNIKVLYKDNFELSLIKELIKYPDLILEATKSLEVHHLTYFGINLAKTFHQFYKNCSVLEAPDEKSKNSRLALVAATLIVLKNLLSLLGIDAPEKM
jgi:arginyl-tRNA synthetase